MTSGPQIDPAKALNVGVAAHIQAASPGGPRYDPSMPSDARRAPENAIWLCQTCAKLVDNDSTMFNVETLRGWKHAVENEALSSIGKTVASTDAADGDQRKTSVLLSWKGKVVTLAQMNTGRAVILLGPVRARSVATLTDANDLFVTLRVGDSTRSISRDNLSVSFDAENGRLELQERHA